MAVLGGGERDLTIKLLADVDSFKKNMNSASKQTDDFGSKTGAAMKKVGIAVAAAAAAAGAFAVKFGVDAVKAASDLQETLSKTGEIFGDSAAQVEKFAAAAATTLGQSKQQALDAASTFAIFGKSAGLAGQDLVNFSTDFTVLASDLASFNNTSPEEAITAIGAALRGEAEPLRRYGVLLDDASLRQAALELGIISTTKQALTPQQKVLAAQKLIFEQTSTAQGDFARTSDGLANSQRILSAQFENVKTTVGTALLPIVTKLFQVVLTDVVPIFQRLSDTFSKNVTPQLEKLWQFIEKNLLPILKVWWNFLFRDLIPTLANALRPILDIILTGFQFLVDKVKENEEGFRTFLGIVDAVWQFLKTYVIPLFQTALITAINLVFRAIGDLIDGFGKVFEIIQKVARFLGFDLRFEIDKATNSTNANATATANAYRQFQEFNKTGKDDTLPLLTGMNNGFNSIASSSNAAAAGIKAVTEAQRAQRALDKELAALAAGGAAPPTISADLARFYRSELGLISQFGGKIEGINLRPTDPFYGFGKGGDVGLAISQRRGGSATATGNTIINVNGTVLDPEGTARAVQQVIQQSGGRAGFLNLSPVLAIE
jgi:hypothetical protein